MESISMSRVAAVLAWFSGLGFGLPGIYAIWHMLQGRGIARVMGLPTYGEGTFEHFGIKSTIPLIFGFVLVCTMECAVGWMLWRGDRGGAVLALALLPIELTYWIGFSLPFGPLFAAVRTALILIDWTSFA
jgi:hypothetical protein